MQHLVPVRPHHRRAPRKRRRRTKYASVFAPPLLALLVCCVVLYVVGFVVQQYPITIPILVVVGPVIFFTLKKPKRMTKPLKMAPKNKVVPDTRYISQEMRRYILERDHHRCCECGSVSQLEIDHCIPLSKGGATSINNLQVLCQNCNRKKGNKE